jgi:hypothetical protein
VSGILAQGEDATIDQGMERLDAAAQDLREVGQLLNALDLDTGLAEQGLRAARRIQLDAELGQTPSEVHYPGLVEHADQRAHATLGAAVIPGRARLCRPGL